MARARWLKPEFFTDSKVSGLSDQAALLFAAIWTECDDGGVCPGDPKVIYGRRFITRRRWTERTVKTALQELVAARLVLAFEHRSESFLLIPDFADKQGITPKQWRHLGREHATVVKRVLEAAQKSNGVPTDSNAVSLPLTPKPLAVAVAVAVSHSHSSSPYTEEFERAWKAYPKRAGGNSKAEAFEAWNARLKQGVPVEVMLAGLNRYASYCAAVGYTGTQFVKQAARFFGPKRHFDETWEAPAAQPPSGRRVPDPFLDESTEQYEQRLRAGGYV